MVKAFVSRQGRNAIGAKRQLLDRNIHWQISALGGYICRAGEKQEMSVLSKSEIDQLRVLARTYLTSVGRGQLGEDLGAGASAAVFEVINDSDARALKVYHPDFLNGANGAAELRRLSLQSRLIGHACPNLVQIFAVNSAESTCFVEMELLRASDLSAVIREVPPQAIYPLISQLIVAIQFLESKGLAHRDIKPQNIKVFPGYEHLKLLDLGVIREMDYDTGPDGTAQGSRKPFVATAQYSSPEYLFWLRQPSREMWHALSIYQAGAVLHDLLMRVPLFAEEVAMDNRYALAMAVLQKVPVTFSEDAPPWLCALAARCLTKDMERRVAMVRWEDFADDSTRRASILRRFQEVRERGVGEPEDGGRHHEAVLLRNELMDQVSETLYAKSKEAFQGCQLERSKRSDTRILTLRIPRSELFVEFSMSFQWSSVGADEVAQVSACGFLRQGDVSLEQARNDSPIGTLTGSSVEQVAIALCDCLISYIGNALDLAQMGKGKIDQIVSLDKPSQ